MASVDQAAFHARTGRRSFLKAILGLPVVLATIPAYSSTNGICLLLLRDPGYRNAAGEIDNCVRCIPGKLYGVPNHIDWDRDPMAMRGVGLEFLADTVEMSFNENAVNTSSIPLGTYRAFVREDGSKSWMWTGRSKGQGRVDPDRAWRIQLEGVSGGRTAIQFHYGNDVGWSRGYIIVGHNMTTICQANPCRFSDSPAAAVRTIREYVAPRLNRSDERLLVRIDDRPEF